MGERENMNEEALIYQTMRENEERCGITVETRAMRLEYAVAGVVNECPDTLTLAVLESACNVEALAREYPEVRVYYPACDGEAYADAEEVRRFAAARLRRVLEEI